MAKYVNVDNMKAAFAIVRITNPERPDLMRVIDVFEGILDDTEAADVVEVRRGRWELQTKYGSILKCNVCGNVSSTKWGFCPYCGADMREEK